MYIVEKSKPITEKLKITSDTGELDIDVKIEISEIARKFYILQMKLRNLHQKAKEEKDAETLAQYGEAAVELFTMLLGKENMDKIMEFYEGDYIRMVSDILPFVWDVIAPRIHEYSKSRAKTIRQATKRRAAR